MSRYVNCYFPKKANFFPALLEDFLTGNNACYGVSANSDLTLPSVNIKENETDYKLEMAIPGKKKEDLNISVESDILTISCEKKEQKEEDKGKYTRREYSYHSFKRTFSLPEGIIADHIIASYEDGILNISLPKKELLEDKPSKKQIPIQ